MSRLRSFLPLSLWLALVWVLLWGTVELAVLLSAVLVAPLSVAACRLPALPVRAHPRWFRLPLVFARFAADIVVSSIEVAWATLRRGPRVKSAVVAVPVRCPSDVVLTLAANRLSLVPGTLVVDIDPEPGTFFVFVLDVDRAADVDQARREADRGTGALVNALGAEPAGERRGGRQ